MAPRPKSVPCGSCRQHGGEKHRHALAPPAAAISNSTSVSSLTPGATAHRMSDSSMISKNGFRDRGERFWLAAAALGKASWSEGGIGSWPKRRREYGGGSGDAAVEFLDVREAALVSVAEAFARRALPWQAQLCPRALQDLEFARVKVRT